jgi:hypothetical protein
MSFLGVSLGIGAIGAGAKIFTGLHQNQLANQINPVFQQYQTSPFAKQQLGIANQLFNGRMAGAASEEQNIAGSQAQYLNNVNRNATDSGQALALGGLSQGQSNQAYNQLGIREAQNKYGLLDNLNAAYQSMIGEGNKVYQSGFDKYLSDVESKSALRNAGAQNTFSGLNDLGSSAFLANQGGLFGVTPSPTIKKTGQ